MWDRDSLPAELPGKFIKQAPQRVVKELEEINREIESSKKEKKLAEEELEEAVQQEQEEDV